MEEKIEIKVPDIGDYKDVPVVEIFVKVGDHINKDDPICSIESEKAVMEIPSTHSGTILDLYIKIGDSLSEGNKIISLKPDIEEPKEEEAKKSKQQEKKKDEAVEDKKITDSPKVEASEKKESVDIPDESDTEPEMTSKEDLATKYYHASPSVRLFARELGVDLSKVAGTGPKDRIVKEDVTGYVKRALQHPLSISTQGEKIDLDELKKFGEINIAAMPRIKKISSDKLQQSWQTKPHVTHFESSDITGLEEYRKKENSKLQNEGVKLTILSFLIKASVKALQMFPNFNASFLPETKQIVEKKFYNIGFAADTEQGLIVPVIKNADKKGLIEIGKELIELSTKARKKGLSPDNLNGGTFTISSLGSIGGESFTPIINEGQTAILGAAKADIKPVWDHEKNTFAPRYMLTLSLSYDHRVIDGAEAARFCKYLSNLLSDLRNILL